MSLVLVDGDRYIVAAFGGAAWVTNVRAAGSATLLRAGKSEQVRLDELPVAERAPVLRAFLVQVRGGLRFFGHQTGEEIVAGADRYPVFRVSDEL